MNASITPLIAECWSDYALLDSGAGRKLERYGKIVVDRPEPQALWSPSLPQAQWAAAHAVFSDSGGEDSETGKWQINRDHTPESWDVVWKDITVICRLMSFRHMGLFPEQLTHWDWVSARIKAAGRPLNVLNLFAYTGAATLAAAAAGASVTHLDASKKAIQWGKDNQEASNLLDKPIRWICDDAKGFVARELRRGRKYDGIILDPPKFGRGPDGERWQIEEDLAPFLKDCAALLSDDPSFMILTAYAMRLSSISLASVMEDAMVGRSGNIDQGELLIKQESGNRYLSTSLYARWSK
ncbi:MAG: class I SAM-dependent methyltransferase [Pseudomonadota bacterium]